MVPALLVTAPHAARALPDWLAPRFVAGPLALWHLHLWHLHPSPRRSHLDGG